MTFDYTWDAAARRLTLVMAGLDPVKQYLVFAYQVNAAGAYSELGTPDGGGNLTLVFEDVVFVGYGSFFTTLVYNATDFLILEGSVFSLDVSSTGDGLTAVFTHDGTDGYSVQIQTIDGRNYRFATIGEDSLNSASVDFVGDGTVMAQGLTNAGIGAGQRVYCAVSDMTNNFASNGGAVLAVSFLTQGVAGTGTGGNPGGGTYEPDSLGNVEASEGSWEFSYNGSDTLTAVGSALEPGRTYGLGVDASSDSGGSLVFGTADGSGDLTLAQTGIADPFASFGAGPGFAAWILASTFDIGGGFIYGRTGKVTALFEYGTASTGDVGPGSVGAVWSWYGPTAVGDAAGKVVFDTEAGFEYDVASWIGNLGSDGPVTGDGTRQTINFTLQAASPPNTRYLLELWRQVPITFDLFEDVAAESFTFSVATTPSGPVLVSSPPWRFAVTNRQSAVLTFLDRLATNRQVTFTLDDAASCSGDVPSDDPEVNIVTDTGHPFLDFNRRLLYAFRREGHPTPWVIRFAGIILQLGREAATDQGVSHFTALDPWGYWDLRPIVTDAGLLPGRGGIEFTNERGSDIVIDLLTNALAAHGSLYSDFGQTAFYTGTIEDTDVITISFEQSTSLGDAMRQLCDTGSLDIVLTPIYDPMNREGICVEVNVYAQAGQRRNGAIFAWDMPSRSLSGIDLLHDGQQMANKAAVWVSSANQPVPVQTDADSVSDYGQYWLLKQQAGVGASIAAGELIAVAALSLQKNGKTTVQIDPTPERSPVPFNEYHLGDEVPVYASTNFGEEIGPGTVVDGQWTNMLRIQSIPIMIADDEVETVQGLLLTGEPAIETVHS